MMTDSREFGVGNGKYLHHQLPAVDEKLNKDNKNENPTLCIFMLLYMKHQITKPTPSFIVCNDVEANNENPKLYIYLG